MRIKENNTLKILNTLFDDWYDVIGIEDQEYKGSNNIWQLLT